MNSNHIYILHNHSFQRNILKIGMTRHQPSTRAKQIYTGATGVPEPFEVIFSCSVVDCVVAERNIHRRLAAFRVNDSREFFRITPEIARKIVLDVCVELNLEQQHEEPVVLTDLIACRKLERRTSEEYHVKYGNIISIPLEDIVSSPVGTCVLTTQQKQRISVVSAVLYEVFPDSETAWHDDFSRDQHPEREIRIWEHIAKAFLKIDQIEYYNLDEKHEIYELLLARSLSPTKQVLAEHRLKYFTQDVAKKIMAGYELAPQPVIVRENKAAAPNRLVPQLKLIKSVIPDILGSKRKFTS